MRNDLPELNEKCDECNKEVHYFLTEVEHVVTGETKNVCIDCLRALLRGDWDEIIM